MLAPIEAAWLFLKSQPTERDQRNMNEEWEKRMEPFDASMIDSRFPYNRGEQEPQDSERVSETDEVPFDPTYQMRARLQAAPRPKGQRSLLDYPERPE